MNSTTIGFALCGSFCTHQKALQQMKLLAEQGYNILPILSYNSSSMDTRFGTSQDLKKQIKEISGNEIIESIVTAEPIGPKKMCDVLVIAPCTGNTLSKLSAGITDTPVTMAAKSHLRIGRPLLLALATNDALGASGQNIGRMLNTKNIYFVPLHQDDYTNKPSSLVCNFDLLNQCIELALAGKQMQPVLF